MLRHGQRFLANADASHSLDDKIELLSLDMLVERVGTPGRKPPESRSENLASGSLKEVRVRNSHEIRRTPGEVVRLDEEVSVNCFHLKNSRSKADGRQLSRHPDSRVRFSTD